MHSLIKGFWKVWEHGSITVRMWGYDCKEIIRRNHRKDRFLGVKVKAKL